MQYQEYPKIMKHPQHAPAIWRQLEGKGKGLFAPDTVCTQVERFPDITVTDINQEKQYAAKGYRPANNPDPEGYERAMLEAQPVDKYVYQEYPKWKYHMIEVPVIVKNEAEERALGPGWSDTPILATEEDLEVASQAADTKRLVGSSAADEPTPVERSIAAPSSASAKVKKKKSAATPKKVDPLIDKRRKSYRDSVKHAKAA